MRVETRKCLTRTGGGKGRRERTQARGWGRKRAGTNKKQAHAQITNIARGTPARAKRTRRRRIDTAVGRQASGQAGKWANMQAGEASLLLIRRGRLADLDQIARDLAQGRATEAVGGGVDDAPIDAARGEQPEMAALDLGGARRVQPRDGEAGERRAACARRLERRVLQHRAAERHASSSASPPTSGVASFSQCEQSRRRREGCAEKGRDERGTQGEGEARERRRVAARVRRRRVLQLVASRKVELRQLRAVDTRRVKARAEGEHERGEAWRAVAAETASSSSPSHRVQIRFVRSTPPMTGARSAWPERDTSSLRSRGESAHMLLRLASVAEALSERSRCVRLVGRV